MESIQMGSILQKRGSGMTEQQWMSLLNQLEQNGLFLVIHSHNPCMTKSPTGGFIPIPSKGDQYSIHTKEELEERGLQAGHHIITNKEKPKHLTV